MNALSTGLLLVILSAAEAPKANAPTATPPAAAAATQRPEGPLVVRHVPAAEVNAGTDLVLRAQVTPAWRLSALSARWRYAGETEFREALFEKSAEGSFAAVIRVPPEERRTLEYFLVAQDLDGKRTSPFASAELPHPVIIQSSEDQLQREAMLDVYGRKRSRVGLFAEYVSYIRLGSVRVTGGQTYEDWYYRAEADYLYRLFESVGGLRIDGIRVGMGTLRGGIPTLYLTGGVEDPTQPTNTRVGIDYGFSEVDVSLHPVFGVSAKLLLGGNARGFAAGFGGKVRIGRPRGSRVELDADYVSGIGFNATFRLAWDTVQGLPMSAAGQITNVPGGPPGVRLMYRVDWEMSESFTIGGQLGYEARQSIGGGPSLGLAASFAW
ncbi:MAG TPA: hypothetical protein VK447_19145 [Myxococcaceae bacterium]|nr:hypothetical protein [Myxococcaceae bacterium]